MNIRLDKNVRIRLDHEDVRSWKADRYLVQQYKFGILSLNLEIKEDVNSRHSRVLTEKNGLTIVFNSEASHLLCNNMFPKSGISLSDVVVQVDNWDAEKRNRFDDIVKKQGI